MTTERMLIDSDRREQWFHRRPNGISHFRVQRTHDREYLHRSLGLGCTRYQNRAKPTTGGWSPIRATSKATVRLTLSYTKGASVNAPRSELQVRRPMAVTERANAAAMPTAVAGKTNKHTKKIRNEIKGQRRLTAL